MKILLVGVHFFSSFAWSIGEALRRRGAEVYPFEYRQGWRLRAGWSASRGEALMNRRLLRAARRFRPDLIFVAKGELVWPDTLASAKAAAGCPAVNWFPDPRPMAYGHVMRSLPAYDAFFSKNPYWNRKLREAGFHNVRHLDHAYDVELHHRATSASGVGSGFASAVSFIGSWYPYRSRYLAGLEEAGLKIWGPGWDRLPAGHGLRRCWQGRDARGMDQAKVIGGSAININLHHYDDIEGVNQRFFDIAACGGFQLVDDKAAVKRFLTPGREVVCYRDRVELRRMVEYYLGRPEERGEVAARAYERIRPGNSYDDRMAEILEAVGLA